VIVVTLYPKQEKNALSQNFFGCSLLYVIFETQDGIIFKAIFMISDSGMN
jgi:hypothetical protein